MIYYKKKKRLCPLFSVQLGGNMWKIASQERKMLQTQIILQTVNVVNDYWYVKKRWQWWIYMKPSKILPHQNFVKGQNLGEVP